ncbi:MAG: hypothetical protein ABH833_01505 [Parcubacteria group bacterium]
MRKDNVLKFKTAEQIKQEKIKKEAILEMERILDKTRSFVDDIPSQIERLRSFEAGMEEIKGNKLFNEKRYRKFRDQVLYRIGNLDKRFSESVNQEESALFFKYNQFEIQWDRTLGEVVNPVYLLHSAIKKLPKELSHVPDSNMADRIRNLETAIVSFREKYLFELGSVRKRSSVEAIKAEFVSDLEYLRSELSELLGNDEKD